VLEILLQFGGEIDVRDLSGMTPLSWACCHNHAKTVSLLLARGADSSAVDHRGSNCACLAAEKEDMEEGVFRALAHAGGDLNAPLPNGDTPLHVALKGGHRGTAIALLRSGSDMMRTNLKGRRAIDCAASTQLQYAIKKEAGKRDVMISYLHSHAAFAEKIKASLEANQITTWFDVMDPSGIGGGAVWREEIATGILNASVVLCILSNDYPRSQWCMKELALAKQCTPPISSP
jgi:hypothetical protein